MIKNNTLSECLALPNGQSSPGILQSGQQPSKAMRQIPQFSSLATHRHVATPIHLLYITT